MTLPLGCQTCSVCQNLIVVEPLYCSTCSSREFIAEPICSPACLKHASCGHDSLHRARSHPPPGISPVWRSACGRCLIATADFNPGDVILCERPILSGTWRQCNMQFNSLSDEERDRILSFSAADDDELVEDAQRIARNQIDPNEYMSHTADLVQILHNNSIDMANGDCALFDYGSLIAHSCQPNVDGMIEDSKWVVRALLPIRTGDILGWNYNLSPNVLMEGTARRRAEMLELRGFICSCRLCQDVDYLRSLRCQRCAHGIIASVYQEALACTNCGTVVGDSELEEFEKNERTLYLAMKEYADVDWSSLATQALAELGPYHGITGRTCLEAAANLTPDHPSMVAVIGRVKTFLSSPSMINAVLVHDYVKERLPFLKYWNSFYTM